MFRGWLPIVTSSCLLALGCGGEREGLADAGLADATVSDGTVGDGPLADAVADAFTDSGGPMCEEDIRSPYSGPIPCSMDTATCARACDDPRCAEDCFAADPNPACIQCWDLNQLACWNRNGCQAQWNCVSQCIREHCPTFDVACIGEHCAEEDQAYADCFEPLRMTCLERTVECLPE